MLQLAEHPSVGVKVLEAHLLSPVGYLADEIASARLQLVAELLLRQGDEGKARCSVEGEILERRGLLEHLFLPLCSQALQTRQQGDSVTRVSISFFEHQLLFCILRSIAHHFHSPG